MNKDHATIDDDHFDEAVLLAWVEDRLAADQRDAVESHLIGCDRCAELLETLPESTGRVLDTVVADALNQRATLRTDEQEGSSQQPRATWTAGAGLAESPMHANTSTMASRWQRDELLERGELTEQWQVTDLIFRRPAILNRMVANRLRDADARLQFRRRIDLVCQLQHPSVPQLLDVGEEEEVPYYVRALIHGQSLNELLLAQHRQPLAADDASTNLLTLLGHFVSISHAIAFAHRLNISHNSISPRHVIIGNFGEAAIVGWSKIHQKFDSDGTLHLKRDAAGLLSLLQAIVNACLTPAAAGNTTISDTDGTPSANPHPSCYDQLRAICQQHQIDEHDDSPVTWSVEQLCNTVQDWLADTVRQQEKQQKRHYLFSLTDDLISLVDRTTNKFWTNDAWQRQTGWSKSELEDIHLLDLVHPDDRPHVDQKLSAIEENDGLLPELEVRVRCKDGRYRWWLWAGARVPGEMLAYFIGRNVHQRRWREEASRVLLDGVPYGVVVCGRDFLIKYCNLAANRILGYDVGELVGQDARLLLPEELREPFAQRLRDSEPLSNQISALFEGQSRAVRKDGSEIECQVTTRTVQTHPQALAVVSFTEQTPPDDKTPNESEP